MSLKLLHVSDTHLGKRQYGSSLRRDDFANAFEGAIDIALSESVDAVVHTGDLFDQPAVDVPTLNRCIDILSKLEEESIPFYAIVGNHERKLDVQWLDLLSRACTNVIRLDRQPEMLSSGETTTALYGVDSIRKNEWNSDEFEFGRPTDSEAVTIVCMHELFKPFVPEHKGDPYDLAETIDRFSFDDGESFTPDAIPLGDFHSTCEEEVNGSFAFYPGATERMKASESGTCGVYLIDIEKQDVVLRFKSLSDVDTTHQVPRPFIRVTVEFGSNDGLSRVKQRVTEEVETKSIQDSVVAVTLTGHDVPVTTQEVYEYLYGEDVGVAHVVDKRKFETELDVELTERDAQDIEQMIDSALAEIDVDPIVRNAENIVRDVDITTAELRPKMNEIIAENQSEMFDAITIERRQE